jgi:anti-anti-sigma factor
VPVAVAAGSRRTQVDAVTLEIAITRATPATVVHASGNLDPTTAPELALVLASLLGEGCPMVVLDLAHVRFLDTTGTLLIEEASALFNSRGGQLVIHLSDPVVEHGGFLRCLAGSHDGRAAARTFASAARESLPAGGEVTATLQGRGRGCPDRESAP